MNTGSSEIERQQQEYELENQKVSILERLSGELEEAKQLDLHSAAGLKEELKLKPLRETVNHRFAIRQLLITTICELNDGQVDMRELMQKIVRSIGSLSAAIDALDELKKKSKHSKDKDAA